MKETTTQTPRISKAALRAWRERLGLTQQEAERRVFFGADYGGRMWRRWESDDARFPVPRWLTYIARWMPDLPEDYSFVTNTAFARMLEPEEGE